MKKIIVSLCLISVLALAGCAGRGSSGKNSNTQDLRKSPCASLMMESQDAVG